MRVEPARHASHASHHVSHARQMIVPSPFSFLRLLAIWHKFLLSSLSFQYRFVICFIFFNFCQGKFFFFLLSLIFEKVQLQFLKLLNSSAKFLVKKKSGRVPLQLIGKKKSKMNSLQVEMHVLLQFSI